MLRVTLLFFCKEYGKRTTIILVRPRTGLCNGSSIAQMAAVLAGLAFSVWLFSSRFKLRSSRELAKALAALASFFLGLVALGVGFRFAGIGTTIPFTAMWLAASATLATTAAVAAAARLSFGDRILKALMISLGVTALNES